MININWGHAIIVGLGSLITQSYVKNVIGNKPLVYLLAGMTWAILCAVCGVSVLKK